MLCEIKSEFFVYEIPDFHVLHLQNYGIIHEIIFLHYIFLQWITVCIVISF